MPPTRTTRAMSFVEAGSFPNFSRYCCMSSSVRRRRGGGLLLGDVHLGSQLEALERDAGLLACGLRHDEVYVREVLGVFELRHELRDHFVGDRLARQRDRMPGGRRGRL